MLDGCGVVLPWRRVPGGAARLPCSSAARHTHATLDCTGIKIRFMILSSSFEIHSTPHTTQQVPEVDVLNALRSLPVVGTVLQGRMAAGPSTSFSP